MSTSTQNTKMDQLLDQEILLTRTLISTLELEHEALAKRDMDKLQQCVQQKELHRSELEALEQSRIAILIDAGFATTKQGMEQYLQQRAAQSRSTNLWNELLELADNCQQKNQTNGAIVELSNIFTQQALSLVRGRTGQTEQYDASGKANIDQANSRPIAKA